MGFEDSISRIQSIVYLWSAFLGGGRVTPALADPVPKFALQGKF